MTLGQLIKKLEALPPTLTFPLGFHHPHSYRGYYHELAFEPLMDVTVATMLQQAREALGKTFEGYKGGDYTMEEFTDVWLAQWGCTGETLGETLFMCLTQNALRAAADKAAAQAEEGASS